MHVYLYSQEHLIWFNELVEEFLAKKVGVYGVCAMPPAEVDKFVQEISLKFKVSSLTMLLCVHKECSSILIHYSVLCVVHLSSCLRAQGRSLKYTTVIQPYYYSLIR